MSRIGEIETVTQGDKTALKGTITTMRLHTGFWLSPLSEDERGSDRAPTHSILAKGIHGHLAAIGLAWQQEIKHGLNSGNPMFSLVFDDPAFDGLRCAAFPHAHQGGKWIVQTERPRGGAVVSAAVDADAETGVPPAVVPNGADDDYAQ